MEYYKAYDERYKAMHKNGLEWEIMSSSPIVMNTLEKYGIGKNSKILEIGCGEGRDISKLLDQGFNVVGTDVSKEAIDYCKEHYLNGRFEVVDAVKDIPSDYYDFIYSIAVIHMLVLDEDRRKFLEYIKGSLKEDGIALICSMGHGDDSFNTDISKAYEITKRNHRSGEVEVTSTSCRVVTKETLENEVKSLGLTIIQSGIVTDTPGFDSMIFIVFKK